MRIPARSIAERTRTEERHVVVSTLNDRAKHHLSERLKGSDPALAAELYRLLSDKDFRGFLKELNEVFDDCSILVRIDHIQHLEYELTELSGLSIKTESVYTY
mgnify:CR=1 FL=1